MKKLVGIGLLCAISSMSYCSEMKKALCGVGNVLSGVGLPGDRRMPEIEGGGRRQDGQSVFDLNKVDIHKMSDDDVTTVFENHCKVHAQTVEGVEALKTRQRNRMRSSLRANYGTTEPAESLDALLPAFDVSPERSNDLLADVSISERRAALRVLKGRHTANKSQNLLTTLSDNTTALYKTVRERDDLVKITVALGCGLGALAYETTKQVKPLFEEGTRSLVGTAIAAGGTGLLNVIPGLIGAGGCMIGGYWLWGKIEELFQTAKTLEAMKGNILAAAKELKNMKPEILALKKSYKELDVKTNSALTIIENMQDSVASAVGISSDHVTLATMLQQMMDQMKMYDAKLAQMGSAMVALKATGNLSQKDQQELQELVTTMVVPVTQEQPLTDEEQKVKVVEKYNKQGLLGKFGFGKKIATFDDIPAQWFQAHAKWLSEQKLTIQPTLKDNLLEQFEALQEGSERLGQKMPHK